MSVTFILNTQMGPYMSGSRLIVSPQFARSLVNRFGDSVHIQSRFPGVDWFGAGSVLFVSPRRFIPRPPFPRPTPLPYPPFPGNSGGGILYANQDNAPMVGASRSLGLL